MSSFVVRNALPADAPPYIALIKAILAETPPVDSPYHLSEFDPQVEQMEERILELRLSDNSCFVIALADDALIGALTCAGGSLAAERHVTHLGLYVAADWRDQGVGSALMDAAMKWALSAPVVERVELEVYASNERAIHVYEKFGFVKEGRKQRAFYRQGQPVDNVIMARLFDKPRP